MSVIGDAEKGMMAPPSALHRSRFRWGSNETSPFVPRPAVAFSFHERGLDGGTADVLNIVESSAHGGLNGSWSHSPGLGPLGGAV